MSTSHPNPDQQADSESQNVAPNIIIPKASVDPAHQSIQELNQKLISQQQQNQKLQQAYHSLSEKITSLIQELDSVKQENALLKKQRLLQIQIDQNTQKTTKSTDSLMNTPIKKIHLDDSSQAESLFDESKIISDPESIDSIKQFLTHKIIRKASLLYRASDNAFQVKKFHQKCNGVTNTLTVCLTQFGKKIGGFTALSWKISSINEEWKTDLSKESFLFSLTHKDKFTLSDSTRAICNGNNIGPSFGNGPDLVIKNKGNENLCTADIGISYKNVNYKAKSSKAYQRFTGNPNNSAYFRVKQWQVWKLQFE